jgi:3',5'-cyclic AMP phosphodiesterase CpdA
MFRLLHLSDPHFGTERPAVVRALLDLLPQLEPDLVVLSGDITQRARRRQFDSAGRFVAALAPLPLLAVPGNHDIPLFNLPARLLFPYAGYRRIFGAELAPTFGDERVNVVGFNSTSRWRHKHGALRVGQLEGAFDAADTRLRIVVAHHPFACPRPGDECNLIRPAPGLTEALAQQRVDLVLGGHIHDPVAVTARFRYPRLGWAPVVALAGTCLSTRIRRDVPNSFNFIACDCDGEPRLTVERWDWSGDTFQVHSRQAFQRDGLRGWESLGGP